MKPEFGTIKEISYKSFIFQIQGKKKKKKNPRLESSIGNYYVETYEHLLVKYYHNLFQNQTSLVDDWHTQNRQMWQGLDFTYNLLEWDQSPQSSLLLLNYELFHALGGQN